VRYLPHLVARTHSRLGYSLLMSERGNGHYSEAGGVEGPVVHVGPRPWPSLGLLLALLVYACGL
jgi:hypothetical protein